MQSTSLAPLLSATRSRVSCWIIRLAPASLADDPKAGSLSHLFARCARSPCTLQDLEEAPALGLRQRPGLLDANAIALAGVVLLVVDVQLLGALQGLAVQRVAHAVDNLHHDGLVHLGGV